MRQDVAAKEAEIDANLIRFLEVLPDLIGRHDGQYALIRRGEIQDFFESALDAQIAGNQRYSDALFSIQEVTRDGQDLGYYSYALHPG